MEDLTSSNLPSILVHLPGGGQRHGGGSMRTLVQGGWVHRFDGQADRTVDARGKLVSPGFINCHIHAGSNAPHTFLMDSTKADYFGSNFIAYNAGRRGTGASRAAARADVEQKYGVWAAIRGGAT